MKKNREKNLQTFFDFAKVFSAGTKLHNCAQLCTIVHNQPQSTTINHNQPHSDNFEQF